MAISGPLPTTEPRRGGLADARQQAGLGQATHQSEFVALQLNSLLERRPPCPISLIILPTMTSSLA